MDNAILSHPKPLSVSYQQRPSDKITKKLRECLENCMDKAQRYSTCESMLGVVVQGCQTILRCSSYLSSANFTAVS